MPSDAKLTLCSGVEFATATEDKPATFSAMVYTGQAVTANGFNQPIIVDLAGLEIPGKPVPVLRGHDHDKIVGHATIEKTDTELRATGIVSADNEHSREVTASGKQGFPWQMSLGSSILKAETLGKGKTATVNGRVINGPVIVARQGRLNEVSFVPLGADRDTSVVIAAKAANHTGEKMPKFDDVVSDLEAGAKRVEALELTAKRYGDNPAVAKLLEAAIADDSVDAKDFEIACLRAARPVVNTRHSGRAANLTGQVIEAAVCQSLGIAEAQFSDEINQQAHDVFRGRIGLKQLLFRAAAANGQHFDSTADMRGLLRASFGHGTQANFGGFSTLDISGVLANVQNKSMVEYFNSVEQSWRKIAAVSSVSDFKAHTRFSMAGDLTFRPVAKGGEIEHGTLGNESYEIAAGTQAIMLAVTREDIINDDLSALSRIPKRMGRGAALALNRDFWAEFKDDSTFFTSGRGNLITDALDEDGLDAAEQAFYALTDPDGNPMGVSPENLLTSPALFNTALRLVNSTVVVGSTDRPSANVFQGRYTPVRSQYLSGNDWHLLADPRDLPVIEVAFLNGRQTPTIESTDADFNVLGIQSRGYFDYGIAKVEYRGGVKAEVADA